MARIRGADGGAEVNGSWDRNGNWYDRNGNRVFNNDTFNRTVNRDGGDFDRAARDEFRGDSDARRCSILPRSREACLYGR